MSSSDISSRRGAVHHEAEALAAALPPLLVAAERVAATVAQGVHGRRRVGTGETFWQFRRYQGGDSAQMIDWRQSAKADPLYVRETEWEAAQSVWLWRDASPSMDYRSAKSLPRKGDRADLVALALASLLLRAGERVALLGTGMKPSSGRVTLNRLATLIESGQAPTGSLPVGERLPRHARVILIGDFLVPLEELRATVGALASRSLRGHLLQILDPAEETLPFGGRVRFEGPEEEGDILFGRVESIRVDYRKEMTRHHQGLEALARQVGWTFTTHRTDRPPQTPLLSLFLALSEIPDI